MRHPPTITCGIHHMSACGIICGITSITIICLSKQIPGSLEFENHHTTLPHHNPRTHLILSPVPSLLHPPIITHSRPSPLLGRCFVAIAPPCPSVPLYLKPKTTTTIIFSATHRPRFLQFLNPGFSLKTTHHQTRTAVRSSGRVGMGAQAVRFRSRNLGNVQNVKIKNRRALRHFSRGIF